MFTPPLFIIAPNWKQLTRLSADEGINKLWYSHTMKYYAAIKRNGILMYTRIWIVLWNIILCEKGNSKRLCAI
jgi:hypothetical protein